MSRFRTIALLCLAAWMPLAAQRPAEPVAWQPGLVYARHDGVDLQLDLARPAAATGPSPLVVCIHGGAWRSGNKGGYAPVLRMLAGRGYAAAAIDYRLAPRYRFPAQLEDIRSALGYLAGRAAELGIDPRNVALLGDSAGGHLALLAGFRAAKQNPPPVEIRAVVNIFGVTDLTSWKLETEGGKLEGLTDNEMLEAAFGTSDRASEVLKDASPIRWAGANGPAVLTLHGDADPIVPLSQARELHRKLKDAGAAARLEIFPGAGHNFAGADLERAFALTVEHLDAHLRGRRPSFERIDAHVHVAPPPPAFMEMLDRQNVRLLNVALVDPLAPGFDTPEPQATWACRIAQQSGGRIGWAAPMDPAGFESPEWGARESRRLSADFDRGAAAVKVYKSVGLQLKSSKGRYLLPDDPSLSPVFESIAKKNRPLLAHLAEPRSSWLPLDPADPHYNYYRLNPDWHMHRHPERPSWEAIIAARDNVLGAHPALRVVGCHLGSMEHDVEAVAARLEKYPNFAVRRENARPDAPAAR